jgi:hypothetical protein
VQQLRFPNKPEPAYRPCCRSLAVCYYIARLLVVTRMHYCDIGAKVHFLFQPPKSFTVVYLPLAKAYRWDKCLLPWSADLNGTICCGKLLSRSSKTRDSLDRQSLQAYDHRDYAPARTRCSYSVMEHFSHVVVRRYDAFVRSMSEQVRTVCVRL